MGGSRSQDNKAHKNRFASKSSRQVHRTSNTDNDGITKPDKSSLMGARVARLQRNKVICSQKHDALLKEKRASSGPSSSPRVIVLLDLSSSTNLNLLARDLLTISLGENGGYIYLAIVAFPFYKLRTMVLQAPHADLLACVEMAKVAELIAFIASTNSLYDRYESKNPIDLF